MDHVDIAIIGAGMAGLTCAQILQQSGYQVTVLEKSRGVGGRLATRRLPNGRVDHGTCYVSPKGSLFEQFIQDLTARGIVRMWTDAVYELTATGELQAPTDRIPRYVATEGMSAIAKTLIPTLDIRFSQRVTHLELVANQWQLTLTTTSPDTTADALSHLTATAIVITTPAPQAVALLAPLQTVVPPQFLQQVQSVEFSPCIAVMAGYETACLEDWHTRYPEVRAIVSHSADFGWIGLDSSKRAESPYPIFVVQSAADFAHQFLDEPDLMPVGQALLQSAAKLLAPWLATPAWMQVHRWRYAFPNEPLSDPYLSADTIAPLLCAGDWCGGMRVESAVLSGVAAAHALNQQLDQKEIPDAPFWAAIAHS